MTRRLARVFSGAVFVLLSVYGVLSLAGLTFWLIDRTDVAAHEFVRTVVVFSWWAAVPLMMVALLARRWRLTALILPTVAAFVIYYLPWYLPKTPQAPADAVRLSVATFNLREDAQGLDAIEDLVRRMDADILTLHELSIDADAILSARLRDLYPHQATYPRSGRYTFTEGQGVYSKYPITESTYWRDEDLPLSHGHTRSVIDVDGVAVIVYGVHPWPSLWWRGSDSWRQFYLLYKSDNDYSHREAVRRILARIDAEADAPLILMGDLNMSEQYNEYAQVTQRLIDTQRAAGLGKGYTYPANLRIPAVLRLDYVFVNAHFVPLETRVYDNATVSDHLPVKASLALIR